MESFECPQGFQEESVLGQLFIEDIDEHSELWLVRMPPVIELSDIDKKKIFLDQTPEPIVTENGRVLECFTEACELSNLYAVLPRRSDNKLQVVKKNFQGSVLITEGLNLPDEAEVKVEVVDEVAHNSSDHSHKSKKSKRKKNKRSDGDMNDANELIFKDPMNQFIVKNEPLLSDRDDFPSCKSQFVNRQ